MPLDKPIHVQKGESILFELNHPEFGEWSWVFEHNGKRQKHSTFLSRPLKMKELMKLADVYKGKLSQDGQVTQEALALLNGTHSNKEITKKLLEKYPHYFSGEKQAGEFMKNIVSQYT